MEVLQSIFEALKVFGEFLIELIISALWGLYMIFSTLFTKLCDFLETINVPMLPSRLRLLQEEFISGTILALVFVFILIMNISAFNLFKNDKKKAKKNAEKDGNDKKRRRKSERVSERKLLTRCFFGGALGGFLGMKIYRHKTLKKKFTIGVTFMLAVQLLLYSFVIGFFGFWVYLR